MRLQMLSRAELSLELIAAEHRALAKESTLALWCTMVTVTESFLVTSLLHDPYLFHRLEQKENSVYVSKREN